MAFWDRLRDFFSHPLQTIRDSISREPSPIESEPPPEYPVSQESLGEGDYFGSDIPDVARSDRGEIVSWGTYDLEAERIDWHPGPITTDVLQNEDVQAYVVRFTDSEGNDRYFTVHDYPDEEYDLDDVIDRAYEQYQ